MIACLRNSFFYDYDGLNVFGVGGVEWGFGGWDGDRGELDEEWGRRGIGWLG